MILYKDNPNLKFKTVTAVDGTTEYRKNCRKIKDKYYVIDKHCFELEDKWYAYTSKLVTLDYETGKYVLIKKQKLVYGVVGFKKGGEPIFGYFTENKYNNVWVDVKNYGKVICFHENILKPAGYIEYLSDGTWMYEPDLSGSVKARCSRIEGKKVYKDKGYNIEDNAQEFRDKIENFKNYPLKISANATRFAKFLGNVSFGLEVETATGYVPDHIQNRTGVVICRDGSIDNAEYVTVPMRGAKGLQNIKYLSTELCKRTTIDIKCSYHIHIGTLPDNRLFIAALYALGIRIQDELYTMFPYFKTEWKGIKKQDYNQKLRKLGVEVMKAPNKQEFKAYVDDAYYRLFKWLNDGQEPDDLHNRTTHRHQQTAKWNRRQRYYWMNFMNMFFSERKTVEFRLHQATVNHHKMINWLFICNAILKYAEHNSKEILSSPAKITLKDVVNVYKNNYPSKDGTFLSEYLNAYIEDRKAYFLKDRKNNDFESRKETETDKEYTFTYGEMTGLV